jgi:hypothetical protein
MDGTYSLSDIAAVTNDGIGGGMGGGWFAWILLFALFGGNGFGFGGRNQAATTDELSAGFNFSGINNKLDGISTAIATEGRNLDNAICTLGYNSLQQTSALSAQMANCCCDLKTAIHAEGEATRNMIQQDKIESLQQQISALQLNAALCGVVRYPTTMSYTAGYSPFCGYNSCGCANI